MHAKVAQKSYGNEKRSALLFVSVKFSNLSLTAVCGIGFVSVRNSGTFMLCLNICLIMVLYEWLVRKGRLKAENEHSWQFCILLILNICCDVIFVTSFMMVYLINMCTSDDEVLIFALL